MEKSLFIVVGNDIKLGLDEVAETMQAATNVDGLNLLANSIQEALANELLNGMPLTYLQPGKLKAFKVTITEMPVPDDDLKGL